MTGRLTSGRGLCPEVYVRRLTSGPIALGALAGGAYVCGVSAERVRSGSYVNGLMTGGLCVGSFALGTSVRGGLVGRLRVDNDP